MDPTNLWIAIVALGAAVVNGAIGYGFSTIVTPIAVLWISNKVLNPALVTVELLVNLTLLFRERAFIDTTRARALPVILTLLPGVLLGTLGLTYLAVNDVKVAVYVVLLPLVAVQLLGFRRPLVNEQRGGAYLGPGIGFLYALTTISGPPLAIFFRNQGLSQDEFRCTMAQVRVAEASLTLTTYLLFTLFLGAGLVTAPSLGLTPYLLVPVLIGVPVGAWMMGRASRDVFSRIVMAIDGLVVSFGLSSVLLKLKWIGGAATDLLFGALAALVVSLAARSLYRLKADSRSTPQLTPRAPGEGARAARTVAPGPRGAPSVSPPRRDNPDS